MSLVLTGTGIIKPAIQVQQFSLPLYHRTNAPLKKLCHRMFIIYKINIIIIIFSSSESDAGEEINIDHFDFNVAVPFLPNLEELHICYGLVKQFCNFLMLFYRGGSRK